MTTRPVECIAEESLGELLSLPDTDPRRAHLESCPRCRALVVGYRQFLEPLEAAAHSYGTPEETHLNAFRERLAGAAGTGAADSAEKAGQASPSTARGGGTNSESWWSRLFAPPLRPAWGLVVIAIAFGGLWMGPRMGGQKTEPVLRGGGPVVLAIGEAVALPDGGIRLAWQPHPEADRYEVRFYSAALAEIGRRDAGSEAIVTIGSAEMPEAYRSGGLVLYRIVALKGGDDLDMSAPRSLQKR